MGMYRYECMLKLSWTNPKCKQSTKGLYRIRIIHTTIGGAKEVWSKRLVRLVQDTFRIGSDLNELYWFRIASAYVPCLQGELFMCTNECLLNLLMNGNILTLGVTEIHPMTYKQGHEYHFWVISLKSSISVLRAQYTTVCICGVIVH